MKADELREAFPLIPWDEPIRIILPDVSGFACRYCIAMFGVKAKDYEEWLFGYEHTCRQHIATHHPAG